VSRRLSPIPCADRHMTVRSV